ncbi:MULTISPECIES: ABC transporter permease [unclassified Paenibacillus]|uniref:ABC transporter permease n=1 Tax=unclassified Paenibacillus TaxID=185978 RepID=UPI003635ACA7
MKHAASAEVVLPGKRLHLSLLKIGNKKLSITDSLVYIAGLIILLISICALFPQWIAPYAPTQMMANAILKPPSAAHLFGTDYYGRDVFSLVVFGSRDSLFIGVVSVLIGGITGGTMGALSGYIGGWIDGVLMRIVDVLMTIPGLLLALAIAAALGPSFFNVVLAVSVSAIPGYARVMRSQAIAMKGRPFITASYSIGSNHWHIFTRHILPNSLSPLLVMGTIGVGSSILIGSGLSFLGLGVFREIPDWGTLLSQGRGYLTVAWWMASFPGLAITLFVLSVNLIGDKFRDHLDPKKKRI